MCYCGEDGIGSPSTAGLNYIMEFHILQVSIVNVHKCMVYECLQAFSIMGLHLLHMASCTLCMTLLEVKGHITVAISASQYVEQNVPHLLLYSGNISQKKLSRLHLWTNISRYLLCNFCVWYLRLCLDILCFWSKDGWCPPLLLYLHISSWQSSGHSYLWFVDTSMGFPFQSSSS